MNSQNENPTYANLGQRVIARLFDIAIIYLIQALSLCLVTLLDIVGGNSLRWPNTVIIVGFLFTALFYFWILSASGRQTYGYRLAGLELQTADGKALSIGRALWKSIVQCAFLALWCCAVVPVLWSLIDKRKRTVSDCLCGTEVVTVRSARLIPLLATIAFAAALFVMVMAGLVFPFPLRAYYVPSGAMENTFQLQDRFLVNTQIYQFKSPKNGEIVVFKAPAEARLNNANPEEEVDFVKRVVATPGQKAEIVDGQLFIDGRKINEPYKKPVGESSLDPMVGYPSYDMKIVDGAVYSRDYIASNEPGPWMQNNILLPDNDQKAITQAKTGAVPPEKLLVLGDNRGNSNDSHVWGFAPVSSLQGRVMLRYWPLPDFHWFTDADAPLK